MDLRSVAEVCCVSPHTVRKWVREGKLKPLRICRRLLFHPEELAAFLSRAQTHPETCIDSSIPTTGEAD